MFANRRMFLLMIVWALSIAPAIGQERDIVERVDWRIDTARSYYPGDMLELRVIGICHRYTSLVLESPIHPSVRLIESQPLPIFLNAAGYYQKEWVVLYQIGRSGTISLEGGSVSVDSAETDERLELPSISVDAKPLGIDPAGDTAEQWAAASGGPASLGLVGIAVLVAVAVAAYPLWRYFNRRRNEDEVGSTEESLGTRASRLSAQLRNGQWSQTELERFLVEHGSSCSAGLASCLRRFLYSKDAPIEELSDLLGEEFHG